MQHNTPQNRNPPPGQNKKKKEKAAPIGVIMGTSAP
jgi:hypothetical protein